MCLADSGEPRQAENLFSNQPFRMERDNIRISFQQWILTVLWVPEPSNALLGPKRARRQRREQIHRITIRNAEEKISLVDAMLFQQPRLASVPVNPHDVEIGLNLLRVRRIRLDDDQIVPLARKRARNMEPHLTGTNDKNAHRNPRL